MSIPRRVIPGETYLVTRRCHQRTFRLRPSPETNRIFLYALALAAEKTGVVVHAVCVMSNHHHLVVTDVRGVLPDFLRELHRTVAKTLNAFQGEWDSLWSSEATNVVRLGDAGDVVRKMAYVVTNPVEAGLVASPADWPGVNVWGEREMAVERPDDYFAPTGTAPEKLVLRVRLPASANTSDALFRVRLDAAIAARIEEAHRSVTSAGRSFSTSEAAVATSTTVRAESYEVRRSLVPTVAAADPDVRKALLRVRHAFLTAYQNALALWRRGVRDVLFPHGTWWLRVHHGAQVEAPVDAASA
jgi:putative transposase